MAALPFYGVLGKFSWRMGAVVLAGQSIAVFLGALVARGLHAATDSGSATTYLLVGSALAVLCLLVAGLMRPALRRDVGLAAAGGNLPLWLRRPAHARRGGHLHRLVGDLSVAGAAHRRDPGRPVRRVAAGVAAAAALGACSVAPVTPERLTTTTTATTTATRSADQASRDLIPAADAGDLTAVSSALADSADVHATDGAGATALMRAAYRNHVDVVAALVAAGADVNHKDRTTQSAYLISTAEVGDGPAPARADPGPRGGGRRQGPVRRHGTDPGRRTAAIWPSSTGSSVRVSTSTTSTTWGGRPSWRRSSSAGVTSRTRRWWPGCSRPGSTGRCATATG